jgi:hypothetical protein
VDLAFHPADHRQSLAEVSLCMPGVVPTAIAYELSELRPWK